MPNILDAINPFKGTIDAVLGIVDKFIPDPQAKVAAAQAIQAEADAHVEKLRALATQVDVADDSVAVATVQSSDKYVSRSPATMAYIAGIITAAAAVAILWGVKVDTTQLAVLVGALWAHAGTHAYLSGKNGDS